MDDRLGLLLMDWDYRRRIWIMDDGLGLWMMDWNYRSRIGIMVDGLGLWMMDWDYGWWIGIMDDRLGLWMIDWDYSRWIAIMVVGLRLWLMDWSYGFLLCFVLLILEKNFFKMLLFVVFGWFCIKLVFFLVIYFLLFSEKSTCSGLQVEKCLTPGSWQSNIWRRTEFFRPKNLKNFGMVQRNGKGVKSREDGRFVMFFYLFNLYLLIFWFSSHFFHCPPPQFYKKKYFFEFCNS